MIPTNELLPKTTNLVDINPTQDVEYKPTGRRALVSGGTPEPYYTYAEIKGKIDSFEASIKEAEEYKAGLI